MKEETSQNQDDLIVKWTSRFTDASSNQADLFAAYQRWYDSFYAVFRENIAPWRSKVLDPKIASKAINIIAKIALYDPEPNLSPRSKYDFLKAKNNEELLKYQLDNPDFDMPLFQKKYSVISDTVVCGLGLALIPWKSMTKTIYKRVMKDGKIDFSNDKKITEKIGFNDFIPWSVFRAYCTPGAISWQSAPWKILADFKTDDEIESFCKDMGFTFNKKALEEAGEVQPDSYEDSRNRMLHQHKKGKKELWLCYDEKDKEFLYFVNRKVLLGKQKNIYWHGKFPLVPFYLRPRAYNPWGDGIFERSERLGSANDALINHFLDQLDISLNGLILHDINTEIDADVSPGGEIIYDGTNPPTPWEIAQPDAQGFQLARNIINEAIEENTVSNYESGTPRSNMDKTNGTMGGIQAIQDAASDMIRLFKKSYASSCVAWFTQWMSNNQQFLDRKVALRIIGPNGYFPKEISPEDIYSQGIIDVKVDVDAMESHSKDTERQFKLAFVDRVVALQTASMKAGTPIKVNFYELGQMLGDATNVSEAERIIEPISIENDSPSVENDNMLMGKEETPQEGEDHKTHIFIHQELLDDEGVDDDIKTNVQAHIYAHQQFIDQIMKQVEQSAEIAKSNLGGANENPLNQGQTQENIPQGQQGAMAPEMAGAVQTGQGLGSGMPQQGVQAGVPAL